MITNAIISYGSYGYPESSVDFRGKEKLVWVATNN